MHEPVLLAEVMELLDVKAGGTYIDGTVGSAGHARALAEAVGDQGTILCMDRDAEALERAGLTLEGLHAHRILAHANFSEMAAAAGDAGLDGVDGILLDLGVSSEQLDEGERGFSFMREGPLDMRMDAERGQRAAELVNNLPEEELMEILGTFGEEPAARRIAEAIVRQRRHEPIESTTRLAEIIARVKGGRRGRRHPATRAFQALRIAVNEELTDLRKGLENGIRLLGPGGRIAVISYHSLEDRVVKTSFRDHAGREMSLPQGGSRWEGKEPRMKLVNRKVIRPGREEVQRNPRSRSARLRVAERAA